MSGKGWIGVDLDGTLAKYDGWKGPAHIGDPIPAMVERVQRWLAEGKTVKVMTARVSTDDRHELADVHLAIQAWTRKHIGTELEATCVKDYAMVELWDDRAVGVEPNTGRRMDETAPVDGYALLVAVINRLAASRADGKHPLPGSVEEALLNVKSFVSFPAKNDPLMNAHVRVTDECRYEDMRGLAGTVVDCYLTWGDVKYVHVKLDDQTGGKRIINVPAEHVAADGSKNHEQPKPVRGFAGSEVTDLHNHNPLAPTPKIILPAKSLDVRVGGLGKVID